MLKNKYTNKYIIIPSYFPYIFTKYSFAAFVFSKVMYK